MAAALLSVVSARVPDSAVAASRSLLGVAVVLKMFLMIGAASDVLTPGTLRIPHAPWLPDGSMTLAGPALALWLLAGAAFLLGWRTRLAGALLVVSMTTILLLDQRLYSNHLYLLILLCALHSLAGSTTPPLTALRHALSGRLARLDVAAATADAVVATTPMTATPSAAPHLPAWPVSLLRLQMAVVYGYAAVAKLNLEYISGGVLLANWTRSGPFALPELLRTVEFLAPLAVFTIVVEALLAVGMWRARWRAPLFLLGAGLHMTIICTMTPRLELVVFAFAMFSCYVLFLPAARPAGHG